MDRVECVVVGAGVVGLAIARRLAQAGLETVVLEAAEGIGTVTSSRNSEVIHAGIYYPAGSLMARMCVSGKGALYFYCRDHGIAALAYGPLCRGLLSGRITRDTKFTGDDIRRQDPKFQAPRLSQYVAAVKRLDRYAQDNFGKRVIHLAMRWVLDRDGVTFALWGARRPDQLDAVSEIAGWELDASAMSDIRRIVGLA